MLVNYHFHDSNSCDAEGTLEQNIINAIKYNIKFIGISNHIEKWNYSEDLGHIDLDHTIEKFKNAKKERGLLQKRYPEVKISYGCEADLHESFLNDHLVIQKEVGFDFVIGSNHVVSGYNVSSSSISDLFKKNSQKDIYRKYFLLLLEGLKWGQFTQIGHFDVIKRIGQSIYGKKIDIKEYEDIFEKIADLIINKNLIVEINCSGLFQSPRETYPSVDIVQYLISKGVNRWTLGSDSHNPLDFHKGLDEGEKILKEFGIEVFHY